MEDEMDNGKQKIFNLMDDICVHLCKKNGLSHLEDSSLFFLLNICIEKEDYEFCAIIRDEILKR
jgi:hypothetical protein